MPMPQTSLPKHLQIAETLIRAIGAGLLADGARLRPERLLATDHGVSVGTLRRALEELQRQGLLERIQGSGNYIRKRGGAVGIYAFFRLELLGGGGLPGAEVLSVRSVPGGHRIRRLRRLNGLAVAVEEVVLDATLAPEPRPEDLSESLYLHYRRAYGLRVARVEDRVGLGRRPAWAAPHLAVRLCGEVARQAFDSAGRQIEHSRTWFDSSKVRYVNRME